MKNARGLHLLSTAAVALASVAAHAQQPDCRTVTGPIGTPCVFTGTNLPVQKYLGDISLPSSDHVHVTGPLVSAIPAVPKQHSPFDVGLLLGSQGETLGGITQGVHRTEGFKGYALFKVKPWLDVDVRGVTIAIHNSNHSESIQAGPRLEHALGPLHVYAETLAGFGYQYYVGLPVSGVLGIAIPIKRTRFSIIPGEATYTWYAAQASSRGANSQKGRVEGFVGLQYHFGRQN